MHRSLSILVASIAFAVPAIHAASAAEATLYKNPQCGCCDEYVKYLEPYGFKIKIENTTDLDSVKKQAGVPEGLGACHTMFIDGYVVEGLVPIDTLQRLLSEKPKIKGISLPGMPFGAPGMSGAKAEPFTMYEISDGPPKVYAVE